MKLKTYLSQAQMQYRIEKYRIIEIYKIKFLKIRKKKYKKST